jgi:hypothetical protein
MIWAIDLQVRATVMRIAIKVRVGIEILSLMAVGGHERVIKHIFLRRQMLDPPLLQKKRSRH